MLHETLINSGLGKIVVRNEIFNQGVSINIIRLYFWFFIYNLILPILSTTKSTFLGEFQKAILSLLYQAKRKKALLASNLSGIT